MLIANVPNLTFDSNNVPTLVDTNRQMNVVGTRLNANLINGPLQEVHNAIVGMGVTPAAANNQLLGILKNLRDSVTAVSTQVTKETTDRQNTSSSDKEELSSLITQNSTAISGLSTQLSTLSATTDSFNSKIAQQISNSQQSIGNNINGVQADVNANGASIAALNTMNSFREVSLGKGNTSTTHDFNSQGILIVDVSEVDQGYTLTCSTSSITGRESPVAVRGRVIITGVTSSTSMQIAYNESNYTIDLSGVGGAPVTRQYDITFAGNGKAYCSSFK